MTEGGSKCIFRVITEDSNTYMQAAQHAQMIQQEAIAKVELRRRMRATAVPVIDTDVRAMLRQLGEPVTLFGEQQVILGLSCCHHQGEVIHPCKTRSPTATC